MLDCWISAFDTVAGSVVPLFFELVSSGKDCDGPPEGSAHEEQAWQGKEGLPHSFSMCLSFSACVSFPVSLPLSLPDTSPFFPRTFLVP